MMTVHGGLSQNMNTVSKSKNTLTKQGFTFYDNADIKSGNSNFRPFCAMKKYQQHRMAFSTTCKIYQ